LGGHIAWTVGGSLSWISRNDVDACTHVNVRRIWWCSLRSCRSIHEKKRNVLTKGYLLLGVWTESSNPLYFWYARTDDLRTYRRSGELPEYQITMILHLSFFLIERRMILNLYDQLSSFYQFLGISHRSSRPHQIWVLARANKGITELLDYPPNLWSWLTF